MIMVLLASSSWSLFIKSMIAIAVITALSALVKKIRPKIKGRTGEASQKVFCCRKCGYKANADYNAARNISKLE